MIYKYDVNMIYQSIKVIVDNLITTAKANENNKNDLLWVLLDGHYYPNRQYSQPAGTSNFEIHDLDNLIPRQTHFKFIRDYYLKRQIDEKIELGNDLKENLGKMEYAESLVHYEMLLYLKIWEMDFVWTCLYQLLQLSKGNQYNWYLKVVTSKKDSLNRAILNTDTAIYKTKNDLRNEIKISGSEISRFIDAVFIKNMRNAIAHSQFGLSNMTISLSNDSDTKSVNFDDWSKNYFAKTIIFYKVFEEALGNELEKYKIEAKASNGLNCVLGDGTTRTMNYTEFWSYKI